MALRVEGGKNLLKASARIKSFSQLRSKAIRNELVGPVRTARKNVRQAFKQTTLGRKFWARGRKRSKRIPPLKLKNRPMSVRRDRITTGVDVIGMAALIEGGGRIAPHRIRGNPWLVWPGGRARVVNHPGMAVQKEPVGERTWRRAEPILRDAVDRGISKLARDLGLRQGVFGVGRR